VHFRPLPPGDAAVCLLAGAGACQTWQRRPVDGTVPAAVARDRPVRVLRTDASTLELAHPQVVGDSIVGETGTPPRRTAVALADVQRLDEPRVSAAGTGGLLLGGAALLFPVAGVATMVAVLGSW
jgi:hypothetical protein